MVYTVTNRVSIQGFDFGNEGPQLGGWFFHTRIFELSPSLFRLSGCRSWVDCLVYSRSYI